MQTTIQNWINQQKQPEDFIYRFIYGDSRYVEFLQTFFEDNSKRTPIILTAFGAIIYYETFSDETLFSIFHPVEIFDFHIANSLKELEKLLINRGEKFFKHFERDDSWRNSVFARCYKALGVLDSKSIYFSTKIETGRDVCHSVSDSGNIEEIYTKQSIDIFLNDIVNRFNTKERESKEYLSYSKYEMFARKEHLNEAEKSEIKFVYYGYNGLDEIFENMKMYDFTNLRSLHLSWNWVRFHAENLYKLNRLNYLSFNHSLLSGADFYQLISQNRNLVEVKLIDTYSSFIDSSKLHNLTELLRLKIEDANVKIFPKELTDLTQLQKLELIEIAATEIPKTINKLQNLQYLDLSKNKWSVIPDELFELTNLRYLNLSSCGLTELPEKILQLKNLEVLSLEDNEFTTLPDWIDQLKTLKKLEIKQNHFKTLPKSMLHFKRGILQLEPRFIALYDEKMLIRLKTKSKIVEFSDVGLKLMVVQELMYNQRILEPQFSLDEFIKNFESRKIDIEKEGNKPIPEILEYFIKFPVQEYVLEEITELNPDGGDEIYSAISPLWDGEDDFYDIKTLKDIKYLKNLKSISLFCSEKDREKFEKQLGRRDIEVE